MSADSAPPGLGTGLALRAENVTAGYGGDPVIRGITVAADPAEIVSLVGPTAPASPPCSRAWPGSCASRPAGSWSAAPT